MKKVMVRAWEIYKTLEGDHFAKLAMALRMAWAEIKNTENIEVQRVSFESKEADLRAELTQKLTEVTPDFTGSEKQIAWAKDIYNNAINSFASGAAYCIMRESREDLKSHVQYFKKVEEPFLKAVASHTRAAWWIENRFELGTKAYLEIGKMMCFIKTVRKAG